MQKNKKTESRLPDLFVGPLGKAQLNAIKFSEGIASHDAKIKLIEKMNDLNALLEDENTTKSQAVVAEALLEEISQCFFALFEGWDDERTFH
jgi:hypothetical protein